MINEAQNFHVGNLLENAEYREKNLASTKTEFMLDQDLITIINFLKSGKSSITDLLKAHGTNIALKAMQCANLAARYEIQQRWDSYPKYDDEIIS